VKRLRVVGALALGAVALSSCTLVPTATRPANIAQSHVPFGLLGKTIPGTNNGRIRFKTQPVYIVDATGHLTPSSRIVPSPPVLASVLRQLVLGPTKLESSNGYSSALPRSLVILSASIKDGIGYVDLASSLSRLSRAQEVLAVGQLVLTAHNVGASRGIEITIGGSAVRAPLPNGRQRSLVTPADVQSLLNG
jgi:hypothetical protein